MIFRPRTVQEITDRKLWAKAVYPFEITEATEKVSQGGGISTDPRFWTQN